MLAKQCILLDRYIDKEKVKMSDPDSSDSEDKNKFIPQVRNSSSETSYDEEEENEVEPKSVVIDAKKDETLVQSGRFRKKYKIQQLSAVKC